MQTEPERQGSILRRASMACVALPTCGLALAESERYLPDLITRLEGLLAEAGLGGQEITIRMTGCPNGCARPYMAEIGFVGKAPGRYQIWLGGNEASTRLNRLYRDMVKDPDIFDRTAPAVRALRAGAAGRGALRRLGRPRALAGAAGRRQLIPHDPRSARSLERRAGETGIHRLCRSDRGTLRLTGAYGIPRHRLFGGRRSRRCRACSPCAGKNCWAGRSGHL